MIYVGSLLFLFKILQLRGVYCRKCVVMTRIESQKYVDCCILLKIYLSLKQNVYNLYASYDNI